MRYYDVAGDWLDREFGHYLSDSRVLNYDQVTEYVPSDTVPGYPWALQYPDKQSYFTSDEGTSFYVKYYDVLSTPQYIKSLCSVFCKQEIRPRSDVEIDHKVRTNVAMDINHTLAHMQLCYDQNIKLIHSNLKHSIALGMQIFHGGWHRLNIKMEMHGNEPCTIEIDGKKFDGRFRKYVFSRIRDFRFRMLHKSFQTPENYQRLKNLYHELSHAPLVNTDGRVYSRQAGNPSGQACTTPDNSLKNFMDVVVLWHLIMPVEYHTYEQFSKYLIMCINGDDINISVHPDVQHLFNAESILSVCSEIDMEYHIPCKEFRHNYECTFLGHSFKPVQMPFGYDMYLPVIDCTKMRTSMLIFNEKAPDHFSDEQRISTTIQRCCGLRNETFACESCRDWFSSLYSFLKQRHGNSSSQMIQTAFKSYLTDVELWQLFTGYRAWTAPGGGFQCSTELSPITYDFPLIEKFYSSLVSQKSYAFSDNNLLFLTPQSCTPTYFLLYAA